MSEQPVLWHIPISHYNEKARWALAHKGIEHERRAPMPGPHMAVALWLTRGRTKTFPVIELDGKRIGDSTAIIAALEERYPEPPLYPSDPAERARALALEDFFDEELGPHARLLAFHHAIRHRESVAQVGAGYLPARVRDSRPARAALASFATGFVRLRYGVASDDAAKAAELGVLAAMDRLEAELGQGEYLVGGDFTVADLTAAALLYPLAQPSEGPTLPPTPPSLESVLANLADRPGIRWAREMFRRHRKPEPPPAT